jgi:putative ABC transport system permease protein
MHKWLQGFEYRVAISWWMFAIAGGATAVLIPLFVGVHRRFVQRL